MTWPASFFHLCRNRKFFCYDIALNLKLLKIPRRKCYLSAGPSPFCRRKDNVVRLHSCDRPSMLASLPWSHHFRLFSALPKQKNTNIWNTVADTSNHCGAVRPDPSYVNVDHAPLDFDTSSAVVYPNFLTIKEGQSLIKESSKRMKRRRYQQGHWDSVIVGYREVELSTPEEDYYRHNPGITNGDADSANIEKNGSKINDIIGSSTPLYSQVIQRTRRQLEAHHLFPKIIDSSVNGDGGSRKNNINWLPCHAIDLQANGKLEAHVDSVKFSGEIVAGISLMSEAIMRLKPSSEEWNADERTRSDEKKIESHERSESNRGSNPNEGSHDGHVDLYLPPLSLYVLSGMSRYSYTHELLATGSEFSFSDNPDHAELMQGPSSLTVSDNHIHDSNIDQNTQNPIVVARGRRLSIIFRDSRGSSHVRE